MNKLWDEAELKWIKTLSNSPKSSGHATQLSISFRNKANILIWCGFVQLPQNLLCRNKTNWTEKILEEKPPQTHTECFRSCQASPGVVETTASAAWQESKSPSDTSIKSDGEVCVCSHPFMCKCVTFQKKPSTIWTLLYWMCFQSGWWRVKQRLQQAGTTTETMPPTETPPPTCMRWRIIAEVNGVSFLFIWCLCHDDLGLQQHWYRTLFRSHLGLIMRCNPEPHPVVSFHHHLFLTLMK